MDCSRGIILVIYYYWTCNYETEPNVHINYTFTFNCRIIEELVIPHYPSQARSFDKGVN
jgi:hypothetical protein